MICIGYIGVEAFDIILYIGKSISMLNYPLLIIDLSGTGALNMTIYHGMDLDSRDNIVQYRNINYTRRVPDDRELKDYEEGVIFVVYGFNYTEDLPIHPDHLNIVVNPFPHNIHRVNRALYKVLAENINIRVWVRDIVTIDDFERVKGSIIPALKSHSAMYLYYDINDYENAVRCQNSQVIRFRRISTGMRKAIMTELSDIFPSIKPSIIRRAFCLARKGEKHR